jgi:hypothetical protein
MTSNNGTDIYADDSTMHVSSEDLHDLQQKIQ